MQTIKQLVQEQLFASQLLSLVRTTQEISIMEMQEIRESFQHTRSYMEGLIDIFVDVRTSKERHIERLLKEKTSTTKKPLILVLVSANRRFTGTIIADVFTKFAQVVEQESADVVVIGKLGKDLFDAHFQGKKPYTYVEIKLRDPEDEKLQSLLSLLLQYERIDVFEGRYESLAHQTPIRLNINGKERLLDVETRTTTQTKSREFLFEPTLEEIVVFFESQITAALLRLSLHESRLASLGSRISALESSVDAVNAYVSKVDHQHMLMKRSVANRKQRERLAGMSAWN